MADLSLDTQLNLADVRLRVLNRQPVTPDEYRILLAALRRDREGAARSNAAAKRVAKRTMDATTKPRISLDEYFPGMSATQETPTDDDSTDR